MSLPEGKHGLDHRLIIQAIVIVPRKPRAPPIDADGCLQGQSAPCRTLSGARDPRAGNPNPPAVHGIRILGNLNDETVRNEMYRAVAADWQGHGADVFLYEFPLSAGFKHDLIDPAQPYQATTQVYPELISLITADQPAAP